MLIKANERPVRICKKCLFYSNIKRYCKSNKQRCNKCSSLEHKTEECEEEAYCLHCKSISHGPTDRNDCEELKKQEIICQIMSGDNVTFAEAKFVYRATDIMDETSHTMAYYPHEFPDTLKSRENELMQDPTRNKNFLTRGKYATVAKQTPPNQRPAQSPPYPRELLYRANQCPMQCNL